jgi:hypothetical protein
MWLERMVPRMICVRRKSCGGSSLREASDDNAMRGNAFRHKTVNDLVDGSNRSGQPGRVIARGRGEGPRLINVTPCGHDLALVLGDGCGGGWGAHRLHVDTNFSAQPFNGLLQEA